MDFSVIIPTYNRLSQLKLTLQSVLQQDYTVYEVIVVDDGSTDGTDSYLKSLVIPKLKWISQNNKGPADARNAGIKLSQGTHIAFTDDDCTVPPNWLSRLKDVFDSAGVDIVGGAVHNANNRNYFSETSQHVTNFFVDHLNREDKLAPFLTSNNIAYRTDVLTKVGGFDERFKKAGGEERALNLKILNAGGKSLYASDIVVEHNHRMNFSKFIRQQLNYGQGAYVLYKVVGKELQSKTKFIPFSTYIKLACSLFTENLLVGLIKCALFFVGQTFVVLGFCIQALKRK